MITSYKNNQRHESLEMVVSRGQVDFNAAYSFPDNDDYFAFNVIGGNNTLYPTDSVFSPFVFKPSDHHILPRGAVLTNTDNQQMNWSNSNSITDFGLNIGFNNFLSSPVREGAVYNSSPPNGLSILDTYTPFIEPTRPTYHSKIFPIFAQGQDTNIIELFNIELPYVKVEVLRGEVTNCVPTDLLNTFGADSTQVKGEMRKNEYFNYPIYNAIEVLFCTKSLQPSGNFRKGAAWYKKVFLINYDLYVETETPFPGVDQGIISRHYWRPTGIIPQQGGNIDTHIDKFNNYASDQTVTQSNPIFFNLNSDWFSSQLLSEGSVTQDDTNKKATLKAEVQTSISFTFDPNLYSLKGIAKLI